MMDGESAGNKEHRKRQAGAKSNKKKRKHEKQEGLTPQQRNPKAFSYHSVNKVAKAVRRTLDIKERKHHIPVVDRTPLEPPPFVVAVVGPPKVGKTTLIQCLIKNYTKQKLSSIKGPVTIVSGKKRRLTLIECNNDINCMIDLAKVADLVLLLIDASFGFEMEIFEFLNICQVHGFPKIMGVLTHLDHFKNNKQLSRTKKKLKHRFWKEVHEGAKLFYLSGMVNNEYQNTEIHNLGRFISVAKFRPLLWRTTHPYVLTDRMEDVTDPEKLRVEPKTDRNVCLYGYVRGTHLKNRSHVAIPGCGDFVVSDVNLLPDPCPLPEAEKKRSLNQRERLMYSPFSGVGGIVYDKDAVYIDLGGSHSMKEEEEQKNKPVSRLVSNIISTQSTIDQKMESSEVKLFNEAPALQSSHVRSLMGEEEIPSSTLRRPVPFDDDASDNGDSDDSAFSEQGDDEDGLDRSFEGEGYQYESDEDTDSDDDVAMETDGNEEYEEMTGVEVEDSAGTTEDTSSLRWKQNLAAKAQEAFLKRQRDTPNLRKLVYGENYTAQATGGDCGEASTDTEVGGLFKLSRSIAKVHDQQNNHNDLDCSRFPVDYIKEWSLDEVRESIKDCFVTGSWEAEKDAETLLNQDDEVFGDFEDLETGEQHTAPPGGEDGNREESEEDQPHVVVDAATRKQQYMAKVKDKREAKKKRLKAMFDAAYDEVSDGTDKATYFDDWKAQMDQQAQMNREEFQDLDDEMRTQYEGFRSGQYVRVQINNVPCEFVQNFDATYPVVLGGLLSAEQNIGYVHVRLKKHRWHKKILKTRDPVIVSMGWRRFQTLTLFSIQDHNGRHRLLKYTPDHLHCDATFWGPITPQNTGMLTVQTLGADTSNFRISSVGSVLELDKSFNIVKKLKLTGTPYKIYKKTAFIEGMFNSNLEVAKFEGSSIRTVSGIRGQIKRAVKEGAAGSFRATFEDKLLLSDIVFVRTWYPVETPKFYNPVTTLLETVEQRTKWQGLKTVSQLRREKGIKRTVNEDHLFKDIERKEKRFRPLMIPKDLQRNLPFTDKPKVRVHKKKEVESKRVAVVRDSKERKVAQLLKRLKVLHKEKMKARRQDMIQRSQKHQKEKAKIEAARNQKHKEITKKIYRIQGLEAQKKKR